MKNDIAAVKQVRHFLILLGMVLSSLILFSLSFDLHRTNERYSSIAAEMGRSLYKAIAAERQQIFLVHLVFFALGFGVIILIGRKLKRMIDTLQDSITRIKRLDGFLPICAQCKKVRLEGADQTRQESWIAIERFIEDRTNAEFTHGLCPGCAQELYPTLFTRHSRMKPLPRHECISMQ